MERYTLRELFEKYGWISTKVWYIYGIAIKNKTYIAHIGGVDEKHLAVCFSILRGEVFDKVYYNYKELNQFLSTLNKKSPEQSPGNRTLNEPL